MKQIILEVNRFHFEKPYKAYTYVQIQLKNYDYGFSARPVEAYITPFKDTFKVHISYQATLFPIDVNPVYYLIRILTKQRHLVFYLQCDLTKKVDKQFEGSVGIENKFSIYFSGYFGYEVLGRYRYFALQYISRPYLSQRLFQTYFVEIETDAGRYQAEISELTRFQALGSEQSVGKLSIFGITAFGMRYLVLYRALEENASHKYDIAQEIVISAENTTHIVGMNQIVKNSKPELATTRDIEENYLVNFVIAQDAMTQHSGYAITEAYLTPAQTKHFEHSEFSKALKLFKKAAQPQTETKLTEPLCLILYTSLFQQAGPVDQTEFYAYIAVNGSFCILATGQQFALKIYAEDRLFYAKILREANISVYAAAHLKDTAINSVADLKEVRGLKIAVVDERFQDVVQLNGAEVNNALVQSFQAQQPVGLSIGGLNLVVFGCEQFKTIDDEPPADLPETIEGEAIPLAIQKSPVYHVDQGSASQSARQYQPDQFAKPSQAESQNKIAYASQEPLTQIMPTNMQYSATPIYMKLEFERNRLKIIELYRRGRELDSQLAEQQTKSRVLSDQFLFNSNYQHVTVTPSDRWFFNAALHLYIPELINSHEKLAVFLVENLNKEQLSCGVIDCCKAAYDSREDSPKQGEQQLMNEIEQMRKSLAELVAQIAQLQRDGTRLSEQQKLEIQRYVRGEFE